MDIVGHNDGNGQSHENIADKLSQIETFLFQNCLLYSKGVSLPFENLTHNSDSLVQNGPTSDPPQPVR